LEDEIERSSEAQQSRQFQFVKDALHRSFGLEIDSRDDVAFAVLIEKLCEIPYSPGK
jgi:hypothetical protein